MWGGELRVRRCVRIVVLRDGRGGPVRTCMISSNGAVALSGITCCGWWCSGYNVGVWRAAVSDLFTRLIRLAVVLYVRASLMLA